MGGRSRNRRRPVSVVAALVAGLVLGACSGDGGGQAPDPASEVDQGGVLRVGTARELGDGVSFDPSLSHNVADKDWQELIYGSLVRLTDDGEVVPFMAESFEVVDDRSLTISLRDDVQFTDGAAYDAQAVRDGLLRNLENDSGSLHPVFTEIEDISVDGPTEVTITLGSAAVGELPLALAGRESAIVSPEAVVDGVDLNQTPVGAGPFVLDDWRHGERITLSRNPDFFDPDSWQLGGVEFVQVTEGPQLVSGVLAGTLDIAEVTANDVPAVEGQPNVEIHNHIAEVSYDFLHFPKHKPPFDDVRVRRAFQLAVDREAIATAAYGGTGEPGRGLWPSTSPRYDSSLEELVHYDPNRARQLLSEAGYGDGLELELHYVAHRVEHEPVAEVVQAQLAEVGVQVDIVPTRTIVEDIFPGERDNVFTLLGGSRPGTQKVTFPFGPESTQNIGNTNHPDLMALVDDIRARDPADPETVELWKQIDQIIAEDALAVYLTWRSFPYVYNTDRVGGELEFPEQQRTPWLEDVHILQ